MERTVVFQNGLRMDTIVVQNAATSENIYDKVAERTGLQPHEFYLTYAGYRFGPNVIMNLEEHVPLRMFLCILGGKGGFGSMLRAIGAQIEKTTNREACRDLSGRRLRDINHEKNVKKMLAKKEEAEKEAKERKKKRLQRLRDEPCGSRDAFHDKEYNERRSDLTEVINDSVEAGLKMEPVKRKSETEAPIPNKKIKGLMLDVDLDEIETPSEDSDDGEPEVKEDKK